MSDTSRPSAGWYPDASNGSRLRYWDGAAWTDHFAAPPAPAPAATLRAPEGTDPNTPWVWLHLFVPLVAVVPMLFIDWAGLVTIDPGDPQAMLRRQLDVIASPAYLLTILLSVLTYAASIVFAYLDHRELTARGVPRPFHWAFAFLSYGVYGIGRGVVTQRRTGRGIVVTWVTIGMVVTGFVAGTAFSIWLTLTLLEQFPYASL